MDPVVRLLAFTALAGLAFMPLEWLYGERRSSRRGRLTDLGFATVGEWLTAMGIAVLVGGVLTTLDGLAREESLWGSLDDRTLRRTLDVVVGLLIFEVMSYAYHRAAHRVPALWRLHQVHHSAESMDWLASFRQHPLEIVLMTLVQNAPLVLLGIPLGAHVTVLLLLRLNTVFVHANLKIPVGPWSLLLATPRFHHRHHQRDGAVRNYASLFPWIDRVFGTHDDGEAGPVGLPTATPRGFLGLLAFPFTRAAGEGSGPVPRAIEADPRR